MPYPTTTMELNARELDLVISALHETAQDRAEWDEAEQAAEFTTLHRKFVKAHDSLITH